MESERKGLILVIDDDVTALDIVDALLEERGFEVARRADGYSALEYLEQVTPDVIVIDLMMPRMRGEECVRLLRANGVQAPVLAFTAIDDPGVHEDARAAGCDVVLTKPCRSAQLLETVHALIRRS
jgi:CheY-like chemotaxis protein